MIVDVKTGRRVDVCFRELDKSDVRKYGLTKSNGWFHWANEFKIEQNRVFGLFVLGNNKDIHGVISIQEWDHSQMVHIRLMESAPHNQFNQTMSLVKHYLPGGVTICPS
jgi:hypothetical protein